MNTYIKNTIYFICIGFALLSCENSNKDIIQPTNTYKITSRIDTIPETFPEYHEDEEIVLGQHRQNPYEIQNMLEAYDLLHEYRHNFVVGDIEPEVNTIYYRVLPLDSIELAILAEDTTIIYFDYPLDCDIAQWGSYYHDPSLGNFEYTWLYAVVPVTHPLPQLHNVEVLAECYIPQEPIVDEIHYDDIPDWQNGFAMLEYMAYLISGNLDMYDPEVIAIYDDILSQTANRNFNDNPLSSDERTRNSFWDFITGVHPEGDFTVENTYLHQNEGIKNAKVFIHNIVKIYCGPIDEYGHYYSEMRFRTHCWYHIRFENHHTLTRVYGGAKFLLGPVHRHVGWHSRYGCDYTLYFNDVAWRYATINNAVETYFDFCDDYHILFPYNMRVWVACLGNGQWAGSTPLFHKRHSPLIYNVYTLALAWPLFIFLDIPDMGLFIYQGDTHYQTLKMYELVFHEFAHASHYEKVGANYWSNYVMHIISNLGYGDHADGLLHGYCGIGEMWGNFAGSHCLYQYMGYYYPYIHIEDVTGDLYYGAYVPALYTFHPESLYFAPKAEWFNPGILAKIHQDSHCSITNIYNALNSDVFSLEALSNSLQSQGIDEYIISDAYETYHKWEE